MHGWNRKLLGTVLAGAALGASAAEPATAPDAELLEFLGTWSGEEQSQDWLDLFDVVLREDTEAQLPVPPVASGADDETR